MRQCTNCNHSYKDIESSFYKRGDSYTSWCRQCLNRNTHKRQVEAKAKMIAYLGGKCKKCSYDNCPDALDFHHRRPEEKDFKPSTLRLSSWAKIKKELDKCILLCANCHRETHAGLNLNALSG